MLNEHVVLVLATRFGWSVTAVLELEPYVVYYVKGLL